MKRSFALALLPAACIVGYAAALLPIQALPLSVLCAILAGQFFAHLRRRSLCLRSERSYARHEDSAFLLGLSALALLLFTGILICLSVSVFSIVLLALALAAGGIYLLILRRRFVVHSGGIDIGLEPHALNSARIANDTTVDMLRNGVVIFRLRDAVAAEAISRERRKSSLSPMAQGGAM